MRCPHCDKPLTAKQIGALMGSISTTRKAKSSRENGKLGGRPKKGKKR